MAGAAKIAANMPPVDKLEDTPEIAVLRDREVKRLIKYMRTTCVRIWYLHTQTHTYIHT